MNPNLSNLQPYPFEKLRLLFNDITPDPRYTAINHIMLPCCRGSYPARTAHGNNPGRNYVRMDLVAPPALFSERMKSTSVQKTGLWTKP